jgi:hypothetical protein
MPSQGRAARSPRSENARHRLGFIQMDDLFLGTARRSVVDGPIALRSVAE